MKTREIILRSKQTMLKAIEQQFCLINRIYNKQKYDELKELQEILKKEIAELEEE